MKRKAGKNAISIFRIIRPVHKKHFLEFPKMPGSFMLHLVDKQMLEKRFAQILLLHQVLGTTYFTWQNILGEVALIVFGP